MPGQTFPQPPSPEQQAARAGQAREKLARAALLRRQAQALQRQHDDLLKRKPGYARPPHLRLYLEQLATDRDNKRDEAARLEQEADAMLH